jgi:hypothetical protein
MSQKEINKGNWAKKDITLLTLLANEATDGSRKLLKKYNKQDAFNHKDLETKLAELYFSTIDKVELEKELAKIHPHRDWLLKQENIKIEEEKKEEPKKEEVKEIKVEQIAPDVKVVETKSVTSEKDGDCECLKRMIAMQEIKSNADGDSSKSEKTKVNETLLVVLGVVGIVAILGITINKK